MATTIKLKNSVTTTNAPSSLVQGEVAINVTDKKVWVGNAATTPIQLLGGGADGNFTNISVSSVATFGAGTVSAPSITTTGDTNTGIFFPAADTIAFTEGGVESMRIDSSGNVGIGTSSPSSFTAENDSKLIVGNGSGSNGITVYTGNTAQGGIFFADGTAGAATYSGILRYNHSADAMLFYTNGLNERMRINSSGSLLIGCTAFPGSSVSGMGITGASSSNASSSGTSTSTYNHWLFYNGNGIVGNINTSGSATAYVTSSDYRLKENIAPMTGALAKVAQLKPCTYTWKFDGSDGQGFIAHELQEVIPDAVTGEKDAVNEDGNIKPQGVDTSFLVATLTAAIQEQQQIINDLKARIETLESK